MSLNGSLGFQSAGQASSAGGAPKTPAVGATVFLHQKDEISIGMAGTRGRQPKTMKAAGGTIGVPASTKAATSRTSIGPPSCRTTTTGSAEDAVEGAELKIVFSPRRAVPR
jgi:hypothetical protein